MGRRRFDYRCYKPTDGDAIIDAGKKALREYYDEEVIVFDSDIELWSKTRKTRRNECVRTNGEED